VPTWLCDFDVILLDIEGTITPVDFVYKTLFPFVKDHLRDYIERHHSSSTLRDILNALKAQHAADVAASLHPPAWERDVSNFFAVELYVHWLIDHDRKVTPLKTLQGEMWKFGYENGTLCGRIFPDVPPVFKTLKSENISICFFSSGSVLAQQMLIKYSEFGNLSAFVKDYFDTTIGGKLDTSSYMRISGALGVEPSNVLFVSDTVGELDAAQTAGMKVLLAKRPGNSLQISSSYTQITSFDNLYTL